MAITYPYSAAENAAGPLTGNVWSPPCQVWEQGDLTVGSNGQPNAITCSVTPVSLFNTPANVIGRALNIKHADMIDTPYFGLAAATIAALWYFVFSGRRR